jgi:proteasome lid subunit RPN8/RPN11
LFLSAPLAAEYWRQNVETHPYFNADAECCIVLVLTTRNHVKGHCLISIGTLDSALVHPREVFRPAIMAAGSAIILMHNHPSGDPTPSSNDIQFTRDLLRAADLLKINLRDHVIVGQSKNNGPGFCSLRELGYFWQPDKTDSQPSPALSGRVGRRSAKTQAKPKKDDAIGYLDAFLRTCQNDPTKLGWARTELKLRFPLDKWESLETAM